MSYTIVDIRDVPEFESPGETPIRPVRHHLGITAFGVTAWVGKEAGDRIVNQHTEDEGNEELYVVTHGRAVFELDGERREVGAGELVYCSADVDRTAWAEEPGTVVLAVGGSAGKAYDPVGWELWYPLRRRYEAGEYDEVVVSLRELAAAYPQYPLLAYNLACCECLTGNSEAAFDPLARAIERWPRFREFARGDADLDPIRDDPRFVELVAEPANGDLPPDA